MEADTASQILPPAFLQLHVPAHWVGRMRKIRGIIPVTNSLFICQFNVNLGQLSVGLGQEQDEATGACRAAWLSYSDLKRSQYYSLSLESRVTQQNILNWFLGLCMCSGIMHTLPKKHQKKSKPWVSIYCATRSWNVSGGKRNLLQTCVHTGQWSALHEMVLRS